MTKWTLKHDRIAKREGWAIFAVGGGLDDGRMMIQRLDDPQSVDESYPADPIFTDDDEAIAYVRDRADEGSLLHQIAIAMHGKPIPQKKKTVRRKESHR